MKTLWHQSTMPRRGFIDKMPGDFLRVMGKVLIFGSIGLAAGIALGGVTLAVGSVFGILASAGAGAACLIGARAVQRRSLEVCYGELPAPSVGQATPERSPSPELVSLAAEDAAVDRYVKQLEAERRLAAGPQRFH